jgi:hypothetical protein
MDTLVQDSGATEYLVVLVQPESGCVLACAAEDSFSFPRITIPLNGRRVHNLQKEIRATWGVSAFILDTSAAAHKGAPWLVAELLSPRYSSDLEETTLDRIVSSELTTEERHQCELLLQGRSTAPVARIGWIDEALEWMTSVTGRRFSAKSEIEQLNAGNGFILFGLRSEDGAKFWLKATGTPNTHELEITLRVSELCPESLSEVVATREDWNAWLSADAGRPLCLSEPYPESLSEVVAIREDWNALLSENAGRPQSSHAELRSAVRSLASLQVQTINAVDVLLTAGAFDHRLATLISHIDEVIAFLVDAMGRQTSTKVARMSAKRLLELGEILRDTCFRLEGLGIPDTLIHNDMSFGNILYDGKKCVFIDWSEAAIGNPFISFERLCHLSPHDRAALRQVYRRCWADYVSEAAANQAYLLVPLPAIFAYLCGRSEWIKDPGKGYSGFESYARSLARDMNRAAKNPALLEALCH